MGALFESTPFGSLLGLETARRKKYVGQIIALPTKIRSIIDSLQTGSFVRGLVKQFRLQGSQVSQIAFAVLRVAVGEIELAKLGAVLSSELKLPNDKAQAMAKEIESELFSPVMLELNQFLEKRKMKKENSEDKAKQSGAQNIVNLKQ